MHGKQTRYSLVCAILVLKLDHIGGSDLDLILPALILQSLAVIDSGFIVVGCRRGCHIVTLNFCGVESVDGSGLKFRSRVMEV